MTLVIPPAHALEPDPSMRRRLALLESSDRRTTRKRRNASSRTRPARIRLRPLQDSDQELFCGLYTDPPTMRLIGPSLTRTAALRSFGKALQLTRQARLTRRFYAILEVHSGRALGICGIERSREAQHRAVDVGIILPPGLQRQGYGQETLAALVRRAFRNLHVAEVFARTAPENQGGVGILRAVGFRKLKASGAEGLWSIAAGVLRGRGARIAAAMPTSRDQERQVGLQQ